MLACGGSASYAYIFDFLLVTLKLTESWRHLDCKQQNEFIMHFENYLSAVVSEDADIFLDYQSDFKRILDF